VGLKKALFLDRDGVVIEDTGFPHLPEHLVFCAGAVEGMRAASTLGFALVIVTNQSGIARGLFSLTQYQVFSRCLADKLTRHDVPLAAQYFCPHLPDAAITQWRRSCGCRKPSPGMILRAAEELSIDLNQSSLVGDRWSDIGAASAAGLASYYLVGNHRDGGGALAQSSLSEASRFADDPRFKGHYSGLSAAIDHLQHTLS
jgi:D-glycero-D-manno-heptose 1,7-bisphosphate phosphatase